MGGGGGGGGGYGKNNRALDRSLPHKIRFKQYIMLLHAHSYLIIRAPYTFVLL